MTGTDQVAAGSPEVELAARQAALAARMAGVTVHDLGGDPADLRELAALFVTIWDTGEQAAPISADLLCSFAHAGASITVARDAGGALCGGAVAIRAGGSALYSVIAGIRPGAGDGGVGFALKHRQRAWALSRGLDEIRWTFDPLVARNGRFNLHKLGARALEYTREFYGPMADAINAGDETDRLTAVWHLLSPAVAGAAERIGAETVPAEPAPPAGGGTVIAPDGGPLVRPRGEERWIRVPSDVVDLRRSDPAAAVAWRRAVRTEFENALAAGLLAVGVSRDSWYRWVPTEGAGL